MNKLGWTEGQTDIKRMNFRYNEINKETSQDRHSRSKRTGRQTFLIFLLSTAHILKLPFEHETPVENHPINSTRRQVLEIALTKRIRERQDINTPNQKNIEPIFI